MAQAGPGEIVVFDDFIANEDPVALTGATANIGPYRLVGQTLADNDAGAVTLEADGLNGVLQLTSPNASDNDSVGLVTATMWEAGSMGTLSAECRVRFADLDTKEFFFGFSDVNSDVASLEGVIIHGTGTTLTLTASDIAGFILSSELTEDEMWHAAFNGGTLAGVTVSTTNELGVDAVAGEFDILRIEIEPNGTVRWYVNGDLNLTVENAVSTSVDLAGEAILEIKGTGANETADLDYLYFHGHRNWTV